MVSINCLLFVSVEVRLFLEWFLSTLLRLFQPTISLRKMGLISRKIFPACESMCVCCPALRSSSRQPVKRYKKLLAEIFPKSLDGPPNERKIVMLICCKKPSSDP